LLRVWLDHPEPLFLKRRKRNKAGACQRYRIELLARFGIGNQYHPDLLTTRRRSDHDVLAVLGKIDQIAVVIAVGDAADRRARNRVCNDLKVLPPSSDRLKFKPPTKTFSGFDGSTRIWL